MFSSSRARALSYPSVLHMPACALFPTLQPIVNPWDVPFQQSLGAALRLALAEEELGPYDPEESGELPRVRCKASA